MLFRSENQGTQRFDASNRLFLILVDADNLEGSWKLKRDHPLLKERIKDYLDSYTPDLSSLLLEWSSGSETYRSYTDAIFVVKNRI